MRHVLIDHSTLGRFCGFTEISENFGRVLAQTAVPDIHFTYMVPEDFIGHFGDGVSYISAEHPEQDLRNLGHDIDIWHSTHQLFKYRARKGRTKWLMTVHDLNFLTEKHGIHLLKHKIRCALRMHSSDYLTVISDFVAREIHLHCPSIRKPLVVIPNGVRDLENDPRVRPSFMGEKDDFFLSVGQVVERKNYSVLLPLMKKFPGYRLVICGDLRKRRFVKKLREQIRYFGLEDRVILAGALEEAGKNWLYAHCAALLMPSVLEGFGLPVIEAMRFAKPVFCSTLTSLPEVGGKYAFYWEDFDPDHMMKVVQDGMEKFRSQALRDGEVAYSRTYDYNEYTDRYIALYRKILETV